jgi:hypothetical protein
MAYTLASIVSSRACFFAFTALYRKLYTVNGLALCTYMRDKEIYGWPYSVRLSRALVLGPKEYYATTLGSATGP